MAWPIDPFEHALPLLEKGMFNEHSNPSYAFYLSQNPQI